MIRSTLVLAWLLVAVPALAQEDLTEAEKAEMAEKYRQAAEPGPEHARLARLEGTWHQAITIRPTPGADPVHEEGSCENRVILEGRFLESVCRGVFGGVPVESVTILGFDRRAGEWTWIALDTMGTYWVTAKGTADESGAIVMEGEDHDPLFDYTQEYEAVLEIDGPDRYVTRLIFSDPAHAPAGEPHELLEIVHTRSTGEEATP